MRALTSASKVYGYKPARLDLEVTVPRRTTGDRADIVVYADDDAEASGPPEAPTPTPPTSPAPTTDREVFYAVPLT